MRTAVTIGLTATYGLTFVGLNIEHDPWSLRGPVHAALLVFFAALSSRGDPLGSAFLGALACVHSTAFDANPPIVGILVPIGVGLLCDGRPAEAPCVLALLAACRPVLRCARFDLILACAAHRAFMCAVGFSDRAPFRFSFVYGQCLLLTCYVCVAPVSAEVALTIIAIVWSVYDDRSILQGPSYHDPPATTDSTLPILKRRRGEWALSAALLQAGVLLVEEATHASSLARDGVLMAMTQSVHVAAVLASIVVIGPLIPAQGAVKVVFCCASAFDALACLGLRDDAPPPVLRLRAGSAVLTAITYLSTLPSEQEDVERAVDGAPNRRRAHGCILCYVAAHVGALVAWGGGLDERIAFAFHYPFVVVGFAAWAVLWYDALAWWATIVFCAVETLTTIWLAASRRRFDLLCLAFAAAGLIIGIRDWPVGKRPSFVTACTEDPHVDTLSASPDCVPTSIRTELCPR